MKMEILFLIKWPHKTHFTLGVEAKGRRKSRDPIGWELKANPKSFRLGVKVNN